MSIRQYNLGSIVKPGFNPLGVQTSVTTYQPYLYAWGAAANAGQLGLGNSTNYSSPKQVGSLTNWSKIAGSKEYATFAIKADGTLWSWGQNSYGELGLGNGTFYSSPKQVGALTNWLNVAGGREHTIATKTDGTLWAWGRNHVGQLGLNNTTSYSSPKQVGSLTTWVTVSCGQNFSFAIKTDGTLWALGGDNTIGQLGLNNSTVASSPVQVGALTTWSNISNGTAFTLATTTSGALWSWGVNTVGQLGLGNTVTAYSSPNHVVSKPTCLGLE